MFIELDQVADDAVDGAQALQIVDCSQGAGGIRGLMVGWNSSIRAVVYGYVSAGRGNFNGRSLYEYNPLSIGLTRFKIRWHALRALWSAKAPLHCHRQKEPAVHQRSQKPKPQSAGAPLRSTPSSATASSSRSSSIFPIYRTMISSQDNL